EERELTVMLAIDRSGSLAFGSETQSKLQMVQDLGSLLAYMAMKNKDRVGLLLFTGSPELYLAPASRRAHALRIMRELVGFEPKARTTDIKGALGFLLNTIKKRAIIFFVSDFQDDGFEKELSIIAKKHDFIAVSVADPLELALARLPARLRLDDLEGVGAIEVDLRDNNALAAFADKAAQDKENLARMLKNHGASHLELSTTKDLADALVAFFNKREHVKAARHRS
ncbi:MAG: VWA domain-containing protein, partial [Elusimicrobiota bacterium]